MNPRSLYRYVRQQIQVARGRDRPRRQLDVYRDDVFIDSYPRSGNTWMRFILGNILFHQDGATDFLNVETRVPDIYWATRRQLEQMPRPRYLKSHEVDMRYRRVIYIVRDPRAVAVSLYYYSIKTRSRPEGFPMEQFIDLFLDGYTGPYSWSDHVGAWLGARQGTDAFVLFRYEDLLTNPVQQLQRLQPFLPTPVSENVLESSVAASSAPQMRALERAQPGALAFRRFRPDIPFIRTADTESWREHLSSDLAARIERQWPALMERLGYS